MTKRISWLVSLSCIVLVLMLSFVLAGCKEIKYSLKVESSMGGNVSVTIGKKNYQLEDVDSKTISVKEDAVVTLKATAKTGYEFEKWILNDGFSFSDELKLNINSDSTYVAVFTPAAYSVTFKHNGNVVGSTNVYVSSNLDNIVYPSMAGYENVSWEPIGFDKSNPSDVVVNTLTGTPINYSIVFKDENDNLIQEGTWNVENKNIVAPAVPAKAGYSAEWGAYSFDVLGNKSIKPIYSLINYTLSFKNGDYVIKTQEINVETDLSTIEYPTMTGYENVTWDSLVFNKSNPSDVVVRTLTADLKTYTIYYFRDGKTIAAQNVNVETDFAALKLPEIPGYENVVWEQFNFDKSNPKDVNVNLISADIITYTATFKAEDDTIVEVVEWTVETTTITEPAAPAKEGYTASWEAYNLDSLENFEVKPVYTLTNYKVVFTDEAGSVVDTQEWNIENKTITEPAVPTKAGFTGAWETYNFDTLQDIKVGVKYSKALTIKYLNTDDSTYKGVDDGEYIPYTSITVVKTTKTLETVVSTYEVQVTIYGQDTKVITIDNLVEYLNQYGVYDDKVIVKIGDSTDLAQGVINAYENSTELKVYFEYQDNI